MAGIYDSGYGGDMTAGLYGQTISDEEERRRRQQQTPQQQAPQQPQNAPPPQQPQNAGEQDSTPQQQQPTSNQPVQTGRFQQPTQPTFAELQQQGQARPAPPTAAAPVNGTTPVLYGANNPPPSAPTPGVSPSGVNPLVTFNSDGSATYRNVETPVANPQTYTPNSPPPANAPNGSQYRDPSGATWVKRGGTWVVENGNDRLRGYNALTPLALQQQNRGTMAETPSGNMVSTAGTLSGSGIDQFLSEYGIPANDNEWALLAAQANMPVNQLKAAVQTANSGSIRPYQTQKEMADTKEWQAWMNANQQFMPNRPGSQVPASFWSDFAYVPESERNGGPAVRRRTYEELTGRGYQPYGGQALYNDASNQELLARNGGYYNALRSLGYSFGTGNSNTQPGASGQEAAQVTGRMSNALGSSDNGTPWADVLGPQRTASSFMGQGQNPFTSGGLSFDGNIGQYLSGMLNSSGPNINVPNAYMGNQSLAAQLQQLAGNGLPNAPQYQSNPALERSLQNLMRQAGQPIAGYNPLADAGGQTGTPGSGQSPSGPAGSGAATAGSGDVAGATQQSVLDLLKNPSAFDNAEVQKLYDRLGQNIDDQYAQDETKLREEMARRGLADSSIQGGRLADLNVGRRSARTELANQLGMQRAQDLSAAQARAIGLGQASVNADRAAQEAAGQLALQAELGRGNLNLGRGNLNLSGQRLGLDAQGQQFGQQMTGLQFQNQLGQQAFQNQMSTAQLAAALQGQRFNQGLQSAQFANTVGQQGFQNQMSVADFQRGLGNDQYNRGMGYLDRLIGYGQDAFNNDLRRQQLNQQVSNDQWRQWLDLMNLYRGG